MSLVTSLGRVGLSITLMVAGVLLLLNQKSDKQLERLLKSLSEVFIVAKFIIPYYQIYYKINAVLFTVSGLFTLVKQKNAGSFYAVAAVLFCATFDNPILAKNESDKTLRYVFLICHLCIYSCIEMFCEKQNQLEEKEKTERAEKEKTQ